MAKIIILLFVSFFSLYMTEQTPYFLSDEYIDSINKQVTTWEAGRNFDSDTPIEVIKRLTGSRGLVDDTMKNVKYKTADNKYLLNKDIPKNFDARKQWPHCSTIGEIRNQGICGSCWAFSTTGAFADRLCMATDGKFNQQLSIDNLMYCCGRQCGHGCFGGLPFAAWEYFQTDGVVTGGHYNTTEGCQPYTEKPYSRDQFNEHSCSSHPEEDINKCSKTCYGNKSINYNNDIWKTRDAYYVNVSAIQHEILTYGPIETTFLVYNDFYNYKKGIYQKAKNVSSEFGRHSVKLIGWGVENNTDYWLLVNSWGEQWGEKGLFRVRKGINECSVESSLSAGVPLVE